MRIDRIELKNWLSYPSTWPATDGQGTPGLPTIRFDWGPLIIIDGDNGVGKSALLDAVGYALFAKYERGENLASAIRNGEESALVRLYFSLPDRATWTSYYVERSLHRTSGRNAAQLYGLTPGSKPTALASGQEEVTKKIVALLHGVTYDTFSATVMLRQNEAGRFMADVELQSERLLSLCRLDVYDRIADKAAALLTDERRNFKRLEADFEVVKLATPERLAAEEVRAARLHELHSAAQARLDDCQALQREIERAGQLGGQIAECQTQLAQWQAVLDRQAAIRRSVAWTTAWRRLGTTLANARQGLRQMQDLAGQIADGEADTGRLNQALAPEQARERAAAEQLVPKQSTLDKIQRNLPGFVERRERLSQQIRDYKTARELDGKIVAAQQQQQAWAQDLAGLPEATRRRERAALLQAARPVLDGVLPLLANADQHVVQATNLRASSAEKAAKAAKARAEIKDLETELRQARSQADSASTARNTAAGNLQASSEDLQRRQLALNQGACPTCGMEMAGEVARHVHADAEGLAERVRTLQASVTTVEADLTRLAEQTRVLQERISARTKQASQSQAEADSELSHAGQLESQAQTQRARAAGTWQQYVARWNEPYPEWLARPMEEARLHLERELTQLARAEETYQRLTDLQHRAAAERANLSQLSGQRRGMQLPETVTEALIADAEREHAEIAGRCQKGEELRETTQREIAELTRVRDEAHATVARLTAKAAETQRRLAGLIATQTAAQHTFEGARDYLCTEAATLSAELPQLASDLAAAIHDDDVWQRLQAEAEVQAAAAADLGRLEEAIEKWQMTRSRIATLEEQLQELQPRVAGVDAHQVAREVGELRHSLSQLSGEANQAERAIGELRGQCTRRAELAPQLARAKELVWAYGEIRAALDAGGSAKSPGGRLRQELIEQIMQSIAEQATQIMGSMRLAIEIAYRSGTFRLKDKRNSRAERRFQEFSGGEQFAISVAVALAVGRVTHGIGNLPAAVRCLFIDEGFGSLDAKNRNSMVTTAIGSLIESGARDQVVLITHVADLNESLAYHISLEREGDHTRLVRAGWRADQNE